MASYNAPLREINFVLNDVLNVGQLARLAGFAEATPETLGGLIEEAAKLVQARIAPLSASGDQQGCKWNNGEVQVPDGMAEAYKLYWEAGWVGLCNPTEYGGQGLPYTLSKVVDEILCSGNVAFALYPGLTMGCFEAILANASDELKQTYLPKLGTGQWTGTMCMTEPQAGSDLAAVKTRATPNGDGSYSLEGGKIFITSGEHTMAENIIHFTLARLPDAPAGVKGLSTFVVPKFLVNADGSIGARNQVTCSSIEHKMGIHGNATCVINLDNAKGWLVGEPNRGLPAMFVMMNGARLGVGLQGLGLTEIAYQNSLAYAKDRLQMRSLSGPKLKDKPADPIIVHPDVRRLLLTQKAYVEAGRAFSYWTGLQIDRELSHTDEKVRKDAEDLVALLTPVIKAFLTDNGFECTNLALQVLGGHGYVKEWGMEQYVRDARINMIYEGTNGVQALDLIGRKVLSDMGAKLMKFGKLVQEFVKAQKDHPEMAEFVGPLADIGDKVTKLTAEIGQKAMKNPEEVGAASTPYLRVVGHLVFSYFWARMARIALDKKDSGDAFYTAKLATARFYFAKLLPETEFHLRAARAGAAPLMDMDVALF